MVCQPPFSRIMVILQMLLEQQTLTQIYLQRCKTVFSKLNYNAIHIALLMLSYYDILQLGSLLNKPDPAFMPGQSQTTPANGISKSFGEKTGTGWPIIFPLGSGAGTLTAGGGDGGLDLSSAVLPLGNTATTNTALSIADFNMF